MSAPINSDIKLYKHEFVGYNPEKPISTALLMNKPNVLGVRPDTFGWAFARSNKFGILKSENGEDAKLIPDHDPHPHGLCPFCAKTCEDVDNVRCKTFDPVHILYSGHLVETKFFHRYHSECYDASIATIIETSIRRLDEK